MELEISEILARNTLEFFYYWNWKSAQFSAFALKIDDWTSTKYSK